MDGGWDTPENRLEVLKGFWKVVPDVAGVVFPKRDGVAEVVAAVVVAGVVLAVGVA